VVAARAAAMAEIVPVERSQRTQHSGRYGRLVLAKCCRQVAMDSRLAPEQVNYAAARRPRWPIGADAWMRQRAGAACNLCQRANCVFHASGFVSSDTVRYVHASVSVHDGTLRVRRNGDLNKGWTPPPAVGQASQLASQRSRAASLSMSRIALRILHLDESPPNAHQARSLHVQLVVREWWRKSGRTTRVDAVNRSEGANASDGGTSSSANQLSRGLRAHHQLLECAG
jgi:hypothetical protein